MAALLIKNNMEEIINELLFLSPCKGEGKRKKRACLSHKYMK